MSDIVERLLADKSEPTIYENVVRKTPATAIEVEAAHEITHLRAALESERERCAKVAEQCYAKATDTDWDIGFEQAKEKIAASIRALPPPEGKP